MILLKILVVTWTIEVAIALVFMNKERIENKKHKCQYCGMYSYQQVVIKALPPFEKHELHFCSGECKELWIDMQLPIEARRFRHE